MTRHELDVALTEWAVPLRGVSREDRSYHLFFVPRVANFFVGIVAPNASQSAVITVLEKRQYEHSFGALPADALRVAAYRALPATDFERWASTFDWAAQRLAFSDLMIRVRYQLAHPEMCEIEMPLIPFATDALSGGKLSQLMVADGFLTHVIADLYKLLGEAAPEALSRLKSMELTYNSQVVLDMLASGGASLLIRLKSRPINRKALTLFGTFVHGLRLHQFQKTSPRIPSEFAFEDRLENLCQSDEFLATVRDEIAKRVPPAELLQALASLSDLHVESDGRRIDLTTVDENAVVARLKALV